MRTVETKRDRAALAAEAGWGRISWGSVLSGTLVAYGAFAVLGAIAAAVVDALNVDVDFGANDWRELGVAGGVAVAAVLFLSYLWGGYVAGRMARRGGAWNGLFVFVLSVAVAVGVGALVRQFVDGDEVMRNLRSVGVPTEGGEWREIGTFAGIASLLCMVAGAMFGGILGERWHGKLLRRASDGDDDTAVVDDGRAVMSRSDDDDNRARARDDVGVDAR